MAAASASEALLGERMWAEFCVHTLDPGLQQADILRSTQDDESQPYKSKYAASDLLKQLIEQANTLLPALSDTTGQPQAEACMARLQIENGLVLLETDLREEGEQSATQVCCRWQIMAVMMHVTPHCSIILCVTLST